MQEYRKGQTCEVTFGSKGNYYDCGAPAVAKGEGYGYLCKKCSVLGMLGGLRITRLVEPSEDIKFMWKGLDG